LAVTGRSAPHRGHFANLNELVDHNCLVSMAPGASLFQLTALPEDVTCDLIKGWLRLDDIGKLDSAHCFHASRPRLMEIFKHVGTVCEGSPDRHVSGLLTLLDWLIRRGMQILNWRLATRSTNIPGDLTRYSSLFANLVELTCHDANAPSFAKLLPFCMNVRVLNVCSSPLSVDSAQLLSRRCTKLKRLGWDRSVLAPADVRSYSRMPMKHILSQCKALEELVMLNVDGKHECVKKCIKAGKKVFVVSQMGVTQVNLDPLPHIPVLRFMLTEVASGRVFIERHGLWTGFTTRESYQLLADYMRAQGKMYDVELPTAIDLSPLLSPLVGLCVLELADCTNITTQTLAALLHAPYLRELTLAKNHTLCSLLPEDYLLQHKGQKSSSKITALTFYDFSRLSLMTVVEYAACCPLIKDLLLYRMPHIDNEKALTLTKFRCCRS